MLKSIPKSMMENYKVTAATWDIRNILTEINNS